MKTFIVTATNANGVKLAYKIKAKSKQDACFEIKKKDPSLYWLATRHSEAINLKRGK